MRLLWFFALLALFSVAAFAAPIAEALPAPLPMAMPEGGGAGQSEPHVSCDIVRWFLDFG
jgi:hypothetical protein